VAWNVQLSDAVAGRGIEQQLVGEREMPGATGIVNISGLLSALRTIGYAGPLTVQPFNATVKAMAPNDAAAAASAALDRILA
jgi:sugar phosphate isomerase/epimerase